MSKRLLIYCEGQTEEMIVERLLRNHLVQFGVQVERPILAATSLSPSGQRGGFANWDAIEFDLRQQFGAATDPDLRFTTLHAAALEPSRFESVRLTDMIRSWAEIVSAPESKNQLVNAVHGALRHYDLPDLVELAGRDRVKIEHPVDASGG